jgi:hypothetical protein
MTAISLTDLVVSALQIARIARGELKAVWWAMLILNAANVSIGIRGQMTWSVTVGAIGLVLSVLAMRSFGRDEQREQMLKVFE